MRNFSPADRKWFWETTAQCTVQVWTARQRAAKEAGCYRVQAEVFKALAAKTNFPKVQASRLRIATSYQRLAGRDTPEHGRSFVWITWGAGVQLVMMWLIRTVLRHI